MSEKNPIKHMIDEIEPDAAAKERMFANIQRKAAEIEKNKEETPKKATVLHFGGAMKWALPLAACLLVVVAGVVTLPRLSGGKRKAFDAEILPNAMMADDAGSILLQEKTDSATASFSKEGADEDSTYAGGETTFNYLGHEYTLRTLDASDHFSEPAESASGVEMDSDARADVSVIERDGGQSLEITWAEDGKTHILTNTDGATKEELIEAYRKLRGE